MTVKGAVADPTVIGNAVQPPFIRLPDATTLFERRADRLRVLAQGSDIGDYLTFIEAAHPRPVESHHAVAGGNAAGGRRYRLLP